MYFGSLWKDTKLLTVFGALIGSSAMTMSPIEVLIVAVYRLAGSMPISGGSENCCCWGAEPSNGGKGVGMASTLPSPLGSTGPDRFEGPHLGGLAGALQLDRALLAPAEVRPPG